MVISHDPNGVLSPLLASIETPGGSRTDRHGVDETLCDFPNESAAERTMEEWVPALYGNGSRPQNGRLQRKTGARRILCAGVLGSFGAGRRYGHDESATLRRSDMSD